MTYTNIINKVKSNIDYLNEDLKISLKESSWIYESLKYVECFQVAISQKIPAQEYFSSAPTIYDTTVTSLFNLYDLNEILDCKDFVSDQNKAVFKKKLKIACSGPLSIADETPNSNEPRNTLFELRLFSKLLKNDYNAILTNDHPDIEVSINGNKYFIECKRIFAQDRLYANIDDAINQLKTYSLSQGQGYGVVAVSITRYFHVGDLRFEAKTEELAKKRLNQEMQTLVQENKTQLFKDFTLKIPALILEFTDRAIINGKPYRVSLLDFVETSNHRPSMFYKVKNDFKNFTSNVTYASYE